MKCLPQCQNISSSKDFAAFKNTKQKERKKKKNINNKLKVSSSTFNVCLNIKTFHLPPFLELSIKRNNISSKIQVFFFLCLCIIYLLTSRNKNIFPLLLRTKNTLRNKNQYETSKTLLGLKREICSRFF